MVGAFRISNTDDRDLFDGETMGQDLKSRQAKVEALVALSLHFLDDREGYHIDARLFNCDGVLL